ncbi:hypothetical protein CDEST_04525 [Colletotrichum destructivum]|uniref:Uncharacterized protein n=1 Tax=Colletotrichum destructivum TaxID=34406 RepID=A0AAX4I8V4_9PEZI|nr:hypothetical protein CDEST_04525 [Colletotrichum destructivum]
MASSSRASGSANAAARQSGYYTFENKAFDDEHGRQEYFQIAHYRGGAGKMQKTDKDKETNGQLIERFREHQGSFGVPMHHINVQISKHPILPPPRNENGLCELTKVPQGSANAFASTFIDLHTGNKKTRKQSVCISISSFTDLQQMFSQARNVFRPSSRATESEDIWPELFEIGGAKPLDNNLLITVSHLLRDGSMRHTVMVEYKFLKTFLSLLILMDLKGSVRDKPVTRRAWR